MRVLLVEDEEHKAGDLKKQLSEGGLQETSLVIARSVKDAVRCIYNDDFDLVILDMALPTFTKVAAQGDSGGVAQAVGGIEVLRALQISDKSTKIIIVTQYPDILLGGEKIKISKIPERVQKRYGQVVLGAVLYAYNSEKWVDEFQKLLGRAW